MKWTKYIVSMGMFLGCMLIGFAQQRPQYTQYMVNPFLLNPALSGTEDYTDSVQVIASSGQALKAHLERCI
jgi:hypothetical protein